MIRFDYARSNNFAANVSGFAYIGNSNAKVVGQDDVNWNRYGVSARATYKMIDLYAAFAIDKINKTPASVAGLFDSTATGLTIGADAYVTDRAMLSVRYDNLDAGGMLDQRKSTTFIGVQAKYYSGPISRCSYATILISESLKEVTMRVAISATPFSVASTSYFKEQT